MFERERKTKHECASNNDLNIKKDARGKSFKVLINNNNNAINFREEVFKKHFADIKRRVVGGGKS